MDYFFLPLAPICHWRGYFYGDYFCLSILKLPHAQQIAAVNQKQISAQRAGVRGTLMVGYVIPLSSARRKSMNLVFQTFFALGRVALIEFSFSRLLV